LAQRREVAGLHALFKEYKKGRACRATSDRLQRLSRVNHDRKVRRRKQKTDNGKYSFVSGTIQL
jgi:hypothetical protein